MARPVLRIHVARADLRLAAAAAGLDGGRECPVEGSSHGLPGYRDVSRADPRHGLDLPALSLRRRKLEEKPRRSPARDAPDRADRWRGLFRARLLRLEDAHLELLAPGDGQL